MAYFISDIKKIYRSRMVQFSLLLMGLIAVADPLFVRFIYAKQPGFVEHIGSNPFQFWLLMNSSGWGHTVYRTLLFVFPVLSTGLLFFYERESSVYELMIVRKSRIQYMISKVYSVFIITFLDFEVIFILNLVITNVCFSADASLTEQYQYLIPKEGTFAKTLYLMDPMMVEIAYSTLNALVIAMLSVFILGIHMICKFRNRYIAFFAPSIILYAANYAEGLLLKDHMNQNIFIIIQPRAASALSSCITTADVITAYALLLVVIAIILLIGYKRNRDAL